METVKVVSQNDDATVLLVLGTPFGSKANQDLTGEHFYEGTYFPDSVVKVKPALYEHLLNAASNPMMPEDPTQQVLGKATLVNQDEWGRWFEIEIKRSVAYHDFVVELAKMGILGASSQCFPNGKRLSDDPEAPGRIDVWIESEISLTPTPASPDTIGKVYELAKSLDLGHVASALEERMGQLKKQAPAEPSADETQEAQEEQEEQAEETKSAVEVVQEDTRSDSEKIEELAGEILGTSAPQEEVETSEAEEEENAVPEEPVAEAKSADADNDEVVEVDLNETISALNAKVDALTAASAEIQAQVKLVYDIWINIWGDDWGSEGEESPRAALEELLGMKGMSERIDRIEEASQATQKGMLALMLMAKGAPAGFPVAISGKEAEKSAPEAEVQESIPAPKSVSHYSSAIPAHAPGS
jgi:hypothetical protein